MGEVVDLPVITTLDLDPARVIAKAAKEKFVRVIVIGETEAGEEYFASSASDGAPVLWDLERAKHNLMRTVDGIIEGRS